MLKPDILKLDLLSQFPSKIAVHQADERLWRHPLLPEEELLIKSAQPRRKEEFRAGRHSARAAIQSLGGSNQPILIGAHRQPLWPEGYTGSISHTQTACLAACAKTDHYHAIGIDLEQNEALGQDIIDLIHTPTEKVSLAQNPALPARLAFSAKEALFKALYPFVGQYFDFLDVELSLDIDIQCFGYRFVSDIPCQLPASAHFYGSYRFCEKQILTLAYLQSV